MRSGVLLIGFLSITPALSSLSAPSIISSKYNEHVVLKDQTLMRRTEDRPRATITEARQVSSASRQGPNRGMQRAQDRGNANTSPPPQPRQQARSGETQRHQTITPATLPRATAHGRLNEQQSARPNSARRIPKRPAVRGYLDGPALYVERKGTESSGIHFLPPNFAKHFELKHEDGAQIHAATATINHNGQWYTGKGQFAAESKRGRTSATVRTDSPGRGKVEGGDDRVVWRERRVGSTDEGSMYFRGDSIAMAKAKGNAIFHASAFPHIEPSSRSPSPPPIRLPGTLERR